MFKSLKRLIKPPSFEDEDKNRQATQLNTILLAISTLLFILLISHLFTGSRLVSTTNTIFGSLILVMLALRFVLRLGYVTAASYLLVTLGWLALTYQAWVADGIRDVAFVAYIIIIIVASLLLGWRVAAAFTILSIAAGWAFAYAENRGFMEGSLDSPEGTAQDFTVIFAIVAVLIYQVISSLQSSLAQVKESNRNLQALSATLEQRVAERTQELLQAQTRTEALLVELDEASNLAQLANYEIDVLQQILIFNDRFYKLLGTTAEAEGGYRQPFAQAIERFFHPEDAARLADDISTIGTARLAGDLEYRLLHKSGEIRHFSFRFVVETDSTGQPVRVKGAVQDVTERKQAENALRQTEDIYRQAIGSANAVAYSRRYEDEAFTFMGEQIYNITGYSPTEMSPALFDSLIEETVVHSTDLEHAEAVEQARVGVTTNWKADYRLRTSDGRSRWVADNSVEIIGPDGKSLGSVGIMLDITERKEAEAALAKRAAQLETVTQLATIIATVTEPTQMLQTVVDLTQNNFNLYHAHIYLINDAGDTLKLAAGAGEAGRKMTTEQHTIPFNREQSLVARSARTRQGVIANDVTQAPDFLPNPLLPDTRSELAVPIIAGDTLLGVLDVQSDQAHYFTEEEVRIQTILAAQVAIALQNAHANEQTAQTLQELDMLTRRLTKEGWEGYFKQSKAERIGFALAEDELVHLGDNGQIEPIADKSVIQPIMLRGEQIGQMAAAETEMEEEEVGAILEAISQGLSAHLENLRLNEQTERALADTRQRTKELALINKVVSAISATFDIQDSMQIIVDALVENSSADQARIALINQAKNALTITAECFDPDKSSSAVGLEIPIAGNLLTEQVLATRQSQIVYDPQHDDLTAPIHHLMREQGIEQLVVIPMLVGNEVIGTLGIDLLSKERRFSSEELRLAETLVFQAATAVQNVRLFEQVQARARQEQILRQVSDRVYAAPDAESVLKTAAQEISRVLGVEAIAYLSEVSSTDKKERPTNGR